MTDTTTMTGQCLCGDVKYKGLGKASAVHACHCRDCARFMGGPFLGVEFDGVQADGPVNWFQSSEWGERGSCSKCGSAMFWRLQDGGAHFTVTLGSLDDRKRIAPIDRHIFIDAMPHHYDFSDTAERLTGAQVMALFEGETE